MRDRQGRDEEAAEFNNVLDRVIGPWGAEVLPPELHRFPL